MNQGAKRSALRERRDDLYETPPCAIHTLMRVEQLPHEIWEPCAGRGAISRELREAGHFVIADDLIFHPGADEDIQSGVDFLLERHKSADTIVTNPPFKLSDEFIRHGLELGCDVIALLRLMAIEGASRSDIIDGHLVRIWAGIERLPMMHRDGWEGPKIGNSGAPFAWFVFHAKPKRFIPGIELRRVSWRSPIDYSWKLAKPEPLEALPLFALPEPAE
jgi:hypothetical protein